MTVTKVLHQKFSQKDQVIFDELTDEACQQYFRIPQ
jgi:hypothetical protein